MRARTMAVVGGLVWVGGCAFGGGEQAEEHAPLPLPDGPGTDTVMVPPGTTVTGSIGGVGGAVAPELPVDFGPVVSSDVPPVPIQGGTLVVARDGVTAVAADPDRVRVIFVDLANAGLLGQVELPSGSVPGRVVEDADARVHVVLRRAGEVAVIDIATRALLRRVAACPVPQGLAYDAALDAVHVACTGGELVTLAAADGSTVRNLRIDSDLRDIVVRGETLFVSRFKAAELLTLDASGAVVARRRPSDAIGPFASAFAPEPLPEADPKTFEPVVAWRLVERPDGTLAMLHQRAQKEPIDLGDDCADCPPSEEPSMGTAGAAGDGSAPMAGTGGGFAPGVGGLGGEASYGGGFDCNGIVETSVTHFDDTGETSTPMLGAVALAVDAAISPDGNYMALAVAGNSATGTAAMFLPVPGMGAIVMPADPAAMQQECVVPGFDPAEMSVLSSGQSIGVAFDGEGRLVVQERDPNRLRIFLPSDFRQCFGCSSSIDISLGGDPRRDTGHDIFHMSAGAGLACASCHPGGLDDGHTWNFVGLGPRRTQIFNMGIADTLPLHWDGSLATLGDLVGEVFVRRMGGAPQSAERIAALGNWIETLRPHPAARPTDDPAALRGRTLFESAEVGCATCHDGAKLTNNTSQDVGTGGSFQVPSLLGVYYHEPYLHTGCAATLRDRFDPACGGTTHGNIAGLSGDEIDDLVAYLESL